MSRGAWGGVRSYRSLILSSGATRARLLRKLTHSREAGAP